MHPSSDSAAKPAAARTSFNFNVSDQLWREIVPVEFHNKVVCLPCFDEFARQKNRDYAHSIEVLYFAGRQASFKFQTVQAENIGKDDVQLPNESR